MNQWNNLLQEWLTLYPLPLLIATVILVIIPTVVAIFVRIRLYYYLSGNAKKIQRLVQIGESRGQQPAIVESLEERFKKASVNLEQINTSALIDSIYSQEKLNILGIQIGFDFIDYFCRMLPNLLLSFGLLGTFLGITFNLHYLGQTINQVDVSNVNNLLKQLEEPLQGMGIAFITSLVAIFCSSFLTVINLKYNTNLVKYKLISVLEDYLDNIYFPELPTHSRMDKAVDLLVGEFTGFLYRFGDTVRDAVERSLGEQINKIVEVNETSAKLAEQVYSRLLEASSSLDSSARTFKDAANTIDKSKFADKLVNTTTELDQIYTNFANSTQFLQESTQSIKGSLEKFQRLVDGMIILGNQITHLNEQSNQILALNETSAKLAEQVYSRLLEASSSLDSSARTFKDAANTIDKSKFADKLVNTTTELDQIYTNFANSTQFLQESTKLIKGSLETFQSSVDGMILLGNQITHLNEESNQLLELNKDQLTTEREALINIQVEITNLVEKLTNDQQQIHDDLQSLGERLVSNISEQIGQNNDELENLGEHLVSIVSETIGQNNYKVEVIGNQMNSYIGNLNQIQIELNKLVTSFQNSQRQFNSGLQRENQVDSSPKIETIQSPIIPEIELKSARNIDYTKLRDLLAAGKWKDADIETASVILQAANQLDKGYLNKSDIDDFPCDDLLTIDQLWVKYSNGKFGFSVQKKIYIDDLGGTKGYDKKIWGAFCDRVGWTKEGRHISYSELTFQLLDTTPKGHLPSSFLDGWISKRMSSILLFNRAKTCNL